MDSSKEQNAKNILAVIKQKDIKPRSKWRCLLYNKFVWLISFIFVLIGSLAFSVVVYMLMNNDWDLYSHLGDSLLEFIFVTLPYFWIFILIILAGLAFYISKFTEEAYRFKLATLIFGAIFINILLGGSFYALGMGEFIDSTLQAEVPVYNYLTYDKEKIWTQPEKGVLSGEIIAQDGAALLIEDYLGNTWTIMITEDTFVRGRVLLAAGEEIKIIGELSGDNTFIATEIRPWSNQNSMGQRGMHGYNMQ